MRDLARSKRINKNIPSYSSVISTKSADIRDLPVSRLFFMAGFGIWLFCKILHTSTLSDTMYSFFRYGEYFGFYLCLFSELFRREFTLRSFSLFSVLACFALILSRVNGSNLIIALVIVFASRHYDLRSLLKISMAITLTTVLLIIACATIGLIPQVSDSARDRLSLGFGWVTYLSHYYLEFVICYMLLRGGKSRWLELAVVLLMDSVIYIVTDSKNSFVLVVLFVVAFAYIKLFDKWNCSKRFALLTAFSYPLCAISSIFLYLGVSLQSQLGFSLNSFLSNRIVLTQRAVELYGIHPFGNHVTWTPAIDLGNGKYDWSQYLYVDCSYINILITYGWVICILLIAALAIVSYKATLRGGTVFGVALIIFALHAMADPQLLDLHYCALLFLLGNVFDSQGNWLHRMNGFQDLSSVSSREGNYETAFANS